MNDANCNTPNDADWSEIEVYRIEFDYLKHLTTICTGSILLMVAFLEKLFSKPERIIVSTGQRVNDFMV